MLFLVSFIFLVNTLIFNFVFNVINEEIIICYNLLLFFFMLYIMLSKGATFFIYQISVFSYLVFIYLYKINTKLIKKLKKIFNFLFFRNSSNEISEFLYGVITFKNLFVVMVKFKSLNIFIYFIFNILKTLYIVNSNSFSNKFKLVHNIKFTTLMFKFVDKCCLVRYTKYSL